MIAICRPIGVVIALFVSALSVGPLSAQSLRQPWQPAASPVYARVTITNQTDIAVVFRTHWSNEEPQRHVLDPGKHVTLETTFAPFTAKPELTVRYRTGGWLRRPELVSLPSGHVDPRTDNPGRVYDFYRQPSNVGEILTLSAPDGRSLAVGKNE